MTDVQVELVVDHWESLVRDRIAKRLSPFITDAELASWAIDNNIVGFDVHDPWLEQRLARRRKHLAREFPGEF